MDDKLLQILENSACLSKGQLTGYLKHTLYPEELRAVELHLSSCALCNDALEGMETQQNIDALIASMVPPALPAIAPREKPKEKKEVPAAVKAEKQETPANAMKSVPLPKTDTTNKSDNTSLAFRPKKNWARPMGIAAALLIAFGGLWYFEFNRDGGKNHMAQQREERTAAVPEHKAADGIAMRAAPVPDSAAVLLAKKHADSVLLAKRIAEKQKAKKDSLLALAARGDSNKSLAAESPAIAASKVADAEQDNNQEEVTAKKIAAAPAALAKAKEEPKKEPSDFELGMRKYREKNYASALLYFKSAESDKDDPKHWDAVYYSGLCNRNLNKDRKARKLFERVVEAGAPQKKSAQKQLDDMKKGN